MSSDFAFDDAESLHFLRDEPGPGQRWSTWPATTPSERGPLPHPAWLERSAAAFDSELGIVKTGKEAEVFLVERGVPGSAGCLLAAKRYRSGEHSDFHRSDRYEEGRRLRRSRDTRAVERKSAYGRRVSAAHWASSEFDALCTAWEAGIPVPYPVQLSGIEVLMEFIGDGRGAAPRLAQTRPRGADLADVLGQVIDILRGFARAGFAHGDLSAYNLLVHRGRVVVIDLPQIVDIAANPNGFDFLHRDVVNISAWFSRRGAQIDPEEVFGDLVAQLW